MIMKKLVLLIPCIFLAISLNAQEQEKKQQADPLDISVELEKIEKLGVPTLSLVDDMKAKADNLYDNQQWEEAYVAYDEYAKKANLLANIISQFVEPYYSASYDDRKATSLKRLSQLTLYEKKANEYKRERNVAYVKMGLCKKNLGDTKTSAALLLRALDLIDIAQTEYWDKATEALSEIIGYTN